MDMWHTQGKQELWTKFPLENVMMG